MILFLAIIITLNTIYSLTTTVTASLYFLKRSEYSSLINLKSVAKVTSKDLVGIVTSIGLIYLVICGG